MKSDKIDYVISLGHFCSPALEIERFGFRSASFPFDWCLADSFENVLKLIDNHFEDLFDQELLAQWVSQPEVYDNIKYQISFVHDFSMTEPLGAQVASVKEKYERRIERFYHAVEMNSVFIRYVKCKEELQYIAENIEYVKKILHLQGNDLIIVVNQDEESDYCDELKELGFLVFSVAKDNNDVVARTFFDQLPELVEVLTSRYDETVRRKNIEYFEIKNKRMKARKARKRIAKKINKILGRYYVHNRQVEKYDARRQIREQKEH